MPASVLAIDHGTKRTGFAVADALRITVTPLSAYHGAGDGEGLLDHIAGLAEERALETILVGEPLNMDGSQGPRAADVAKFVARLRERLPAVEVTLVDERLTTKEAESRLREAGHHGEERKARQGPRGRRSRPLGDSGVHVRE